jgi:cytochrome oxidase assembly protein ShyY1
VTLLRPRWIAGHLLVLVLTVSFVALGFWQLARNNHKHSLVRKARADYAAPAPDVTSPAVVVGKAAEATGHFDTTHEVVLRNIARDGRDGVDVLTPLVFADGRAVVVDRGWVAATGSGRPVTTSAASGSVVVRGIVYGSSALSAQDTVKRIGDQFSLPRVDLRRIGQAVPYELLPVWITARYQNPEPAGDAPALPRPPAPDQVNHMQYAIEWFGFAAIGIIGWPIALFAFSKRRGGFSTEDHTDEGDEPEDRARDAGHATQQGSR